MSERKESATGPRVGDFIDETRRYRLTRKIAHGGMGAVYEATQYGAEGFSKQVAVKTVLGSYTEDPEFVRMFIGEAKLVADLVHENIVQVYQLGRSGDDYYIAMEYVDGVNLDAYVDCHLYHGEELSIEMGAFIASRVCRALEHAHTQLGRDGQPLHIVHRDVSPKNVLVNFDGVVKLGDFGVAKARQVMEQREGQVLMGKAGYMSPEQASFEETDHRSDLFSLGAILYELLTGEIVFEADSVARSLENVKEKQVPDPREFRSEIPPELARITLRSLERDLACRYQSASDMGYDLEHYMYHDRYGPTNVALAMYLRKLFGVESRSLVPPGDDTQRLVRARSETLVREDG